MQLRQAILQIETPLGQKTYSLTPGRANSFDELHADFRADPALNGVRYTLFLHPKTDLTLRRLEVQFEHPCGPDTRFLANGYQSWSESRLLPAGTGIQRLRRIARPFMGCYGDENIPGIVRGRGYAHSWSYTYLTEQDGSITLLGSLAEHTGFTLFSLDRLKGVLSVRKDLERLPLAHSFPGLDFWVGQGKEADQFQAYFSLLKQEAQWPEQRPSTLPPRLGWTSWYRYFNKITEAIILENAAVIAASGLPFQYVQIDDGWQGAVGDWRTVQPAFPNGMGHVATQIRAKGLTPGIWLAPFVASARSELARRHPEWLQKTPGGKPLRAGWNPMWGGWFYALDFYHPGVQEYLSGVFHVVTEQWGFELLKLDFLFAACLTPPPGKMRGQVMADAMEFLRRQVGRRKLLACGVPLAAAFGWSDICRIGGDVHPAWEHTWLARLRHRERVSTLASLRSTLARWHLNGQGFYNDPDVFILRSDAQRLTPVQQNTLLSVNALLGGVLFTSDNVGTYTPEQRSELEEALGWIGSRVTQVTERSEDVFRIDFEQNGAHFSALCNLSSHRKQTMQPGGDGWIELQPYETIILKRSNI